MTPGPDAKPGATCFPARPTSGSAPRSRMRCRKTRAVRAGVRHPQRVRDPARAVDFRPGAHHPGHPADDAYRHPSGLETGRPGSSAEPKTGGSFLVRPDKNGALRTLQAAKHTAGAARSEPGRRLAVLSRSDVRSGPGPGFGQRGPPSRTSNPERSVPGKRRSTPDDHSRRNVSATADRRPISFHWPVGAKFRGSPSWTWPAPALRAAGCWRAAAAPPLVPCSNGRLAQRPPRGLPCSPRSPDRRLLAIDLPGHGPLRTPPPYRRGHVPPEETHIS